MCLVCFVISWGRKSVNILIHNSKRFKHGCLVKQCCFFCLAVVPICSRKIQICCTLPDTQSTFNRNIYAFTRKSYERMSVTICVCIWIYESSVYGISHLKTWIMQSLSNAYIFVYYMSKKLLLTYFIFTDFGLHFYCFG